MAGEQKRKARQVLITKALLLGYTIEPFGTDGSCTLRKPDGKSVLAFRHDKGQSSGPFIALFKAQWLAAKKALELAGVLDAKKS
jgi:hypothetical protein